MIAPSNCFDICQVAAYIYPMKRTHKIMAGFAAAALLTTGGAGAGVTVALQDQNKNTFVAECLAAATPDAGGAPVIVVPGFMNNDFYMSSLHARLQQEGYTVYGWGAGLNTGPDADNFAAFAQQLDQVYARHQQKVAVVGYSLGGVYARELARIKPDQISHVVTLGARFGMTDDAGAVDPQVAKLYRIVHGVAPASVADLTAPPPVSTVSLYSKSDRVVPWTDSQTTPGPQSANVEITQGHIAMPFNREVGALTAHLIQPNRAITPATLPCRRP